MSDSTTTRAPSLLARLEAWFLIRPVERGEVLQFLAFFFLVGMGMALGRASADALFFKRYGIEFLPWMLMGVGVSLAVVSTLYAAYCDTLSPERLFRYIFAGLGLALLVNWGMVAADVSWAYPAYFILYEVASEVLLVHGSHYLGQNLDTLQFKRLAAPIFAGVQLGGMAGGLALAGLVHLAGVEAALPAWGVLIVTALALMERHHRRRGSSPHFRRGRRSQGLGETLARVGGGFGHLRGSALLRRLSLAFFFLVVAFFCLNYAVNRVYTEAFPDEASLTAFYGYLAALVSFSAILLQLFVSGRLLRRLGTMTTNLVYPVALLLSYGLLLFSFTVPFAAVASFNKDALMQAVRNPSFNLFYGALPGYMQAQARAMTLVVVLPLALITGGVLLLLAQGGGATAYLVVGVAAAALLLLFSVRMNRAYAGALVEALREKVLIGPGPGPGVDLDDDDTSRLVTMLEQGDDAALSAAAAIFELYPRRAAELLLPRLDRVGAKAADRIIQTLAQQPPPGLAKALHGLLGRGDDHLEATTLRILAELGDPAVMRRLPALLTHANPRLRAVAVYGDRLHPGAAGERAGAVAAAMLHSECRGERLAILEVLAHRPEPADGAALAALLRQGDGRQAQVVLQLLARLPQPPAGLASELERWLDAPDPDLRLAALACCDRQPEAQRTRLLRHALGGDPKLREQAAERLVQDDAGRLRAAEWILAGELAPRAREALLQRLVDSRAGQALLRRIAARMADDAQFFAAARRGLAHAAGPAERLLLHVVEERLRHCIDMSLLALRDGVARESVEVLRAALQSGDVRYAANAIEALHAMRDHALARRLARLLEELRGGVAASEGGAADIDHIVHRCRAYRDPWLVRCADFAAAGGS